MFWIKTVSVRRLSISLVRNGQLLRLNREHRFPPLSHFRIERAGGSIFITIRIRSLFLNIDWV